MSNRIIVVVEGGLVQAVYSNDEKVDVDVLDYDNYRDSDCSHEDGLEYDKLEVEKEKLKQVF